MKVRALEREAEHHEHEARVADARGDWDSAIHHYNEASRLWGDAAARWRLYARNWSRFVVYPLLAVYAAFLLAVLVAVIA